MSNYGRFRCIRCGDRFDLSPDEMADYDEGYFTNDPDTCSDCIDMSDCPGDYPEFSDADPGL
jgi:hypothetical protein